MAGKPKFVIVKEATQNFLQTLDPDDPNLPTPEIIEEKLLNKFEEEFELQHNSMAEKGRKWKPLDSLPCSVIADIMAYLYRICRLSCSGVNADQDSDILAIYQTSGPNEGIYVTSEDIFREIAEQYNYNLSVKDFGEIMACLRSRVPKKSRCIDRDLIAVNNGIFDYRTKQLLPFDSEKVFLTKSHVDYNPNATNVTIHNNEDNTDWNIEDWMSELSDDPDVVALLWEILGAIIRPNVRWNKSAWFYSETGNNGKGTLCELMRQLCGDGSYASISISDFSKDFLLEPLMRASAVIVDENDVGSYIDRAANLKAVITNDVIQINRKFKTPIAYQFYGFMVQCLNEFPRIRDKSDSFYRRQLFIPFDRCFTGQERKYIKNDYLHRQEVLEYVLYKVLNMNYYSLSEPETCKQVLASYKEFNDPVRQFFDELESQFVWNLLPFSFLYDLYKVWFKKNSPSGSLQGRNTFINDLINVVNHSDNWYCLDRNSKIRTGHLMDGPEPLIEQYDLTDWKNSQYIGKDTTKICSPVLAPNYRGIQRLHQPVSVTTDTEEPKE